MPYRVNRLLKQNEHRNVAKLNIRGVLFGGLEVHQVRDNRGMKLNLTLKNCAIDFM